MKFILIIFFIFFIIQLQLSQSLKKTISDDPDEFVVSELMRGKIVMLGDFAHSNYSSYHILLDLLNKLALKMGGESNNKLTLILETTSEHANRINYYLKTGYLDTLLDLMVPGGCLEDLEFYSDLKNIYEVVNDDSTQKMFSLEIKGFEQTGYGIDPILLKYDQLKSELWFINERDSILGINISNYVKSNNSKTLIFYGYGHLLDKYVNKGNPMFKIPSSETYGYFLAYYLKKYFGDTNVITFNQDILEQPFNQNEKDIMISRVESNSSPKPLLFDYLVLRNDRLYPVTFISSLFSKYITDKSIKSMEEIEPLLPGYKASIIWKQITNYFEIMSDSIFQNPKQIKNYFSIHSFDSLYNIVSYTFTSRLFNFLINPKYNGLRYELYKFTDDNLIRDTNYIPDSLTWFNKIGPTLIERLEIRNAIGNYWLGYPDEKIKAKEYLKEKTGHNYQNAVDYYKWYRNKYLNWDYK